MPKSACARAVLSRFSRVRLFATLWTTALQAPLSELFSSQEHWRGGHAPLQGSSLPRNGARFPSISCLGRQAGSLPVAPPIGEKYARKFSSVAQPCPTLCDPTGARQASPSITNSQSLFKLMATESVMPESMWSQTEQRQHCLFLHITLTVLLSNH